MVVTKMPVGEASVVLERLRGVKLPPGARSTARPAGASAGEVVTREVIYFHEHAARMDERAGQRRGEPIGSGPVEATCRQSQCHFKRSGQFWSQEGDEALLCLEMLWRNDRWHRLFPHATPFDPART